MSKRICFVATLLIAGGAGVGWSAVPAITFEDRLEAQWAIDRVYWQHQEWPEDNQTPKPAFDTLVTDSALREKVGDYLAKSVALDRLWRRPITVEQLQAEIDRMTTQTRDPEMLQKLFDALNNDARLIAEAFARPVLVDRLIRQWYSGDDRFHGEVLRNAQDALSNFTDLEQLQSTGARYLETEWTLDAESEHSLTTDEWRELVSKLDRTFRPMADVTELAPSTSQTLVHLPILKPSSLRAERDAFSATIVVEKSPNHLKVGRIWWPKATFASWWRDAKAAHAVSFEAPSGSYTVAKPSLTSCRPDSWTPTRLDVPAHRGEHTAVWTGTEMIIWGGRNFDELQNGARYDPRTDTWTPTGEAGHLPTGRWRHTAVWTGTEMIIWGGRDATGFARRGGRYDPALDYWRPMALGRHAPSPRFRHTAIWTGREMIIWGGEGPAGALGDGARYDPMSNRWRTINASMNAPSPRRRHSAVWTDKEMIVWGGENEDSALNTGARYHPGTDIWASMNAGPQAPTARAGHGAVWMGEEMLVVGGRGNNDSASRYDPRRDTWTPTSPPVAAARGVTALWTGKEVLTKQEGGGAGRYDPVNDRWSGIGAVGGVNPFYFKSIYQTAIWTGKEMIVWGGYYGFQCVHIFAGFRYDLETDSWAPTSNGASPERRTEHTAVWTGTEMVVWGGLSRVVGDWVPIGTGARYDPATDNWVRTSMDNSPGARRLHTAVWTGREMIVWGGQPQDNHALATGGRYDPWADEWTATSVEGAIPCGQSRGSAVWTGREMITWGFGCGEGLVHGSKYDPAGDTWAPEISTLNAPSPRQHQTAVWTGEKMIIWGGEFPVQDTGAVYDPVADTWTPTSVGPGTPPAQSNHSSIWTGKEMIVWGGVGSRYNPRTDTWVELPTDNAPSAGDVAVWTGNEMIVWGGSSRSGGQLDLQTETWRPTTKAGAPSQRSGATAVWTGRSMVVWGGDNYDRTGGVYCPGVHRGQEQDHARWHAQVSASR